MNGNNSGSAGNAWGYQGNQNGNIWRYRGSPLNYQGHMFNNQVNHGSNFKRFQCNQTPNTWGFQGNHINTVRICQGNQFGGNFIGHWNGYGHVNQTNWGLGQGETGELIAAIKG